MLRRKPLNVFSPLPPSSSSHVNSSFSQTTPLVCPRQSVMSSLAVEKNIRNQQKKRWRALVLLWIATLKKVCTFIIFRISFLPYSLLSLGKQRISEGVQKFDEAKEKAKHNVMGKIDEVDRKIETEASKAKGGIMSWFGK